MSLLFNNILLNKAVSSYILLYKSFTNIVTSYSLLSLSRVIPSIINSIFILLFIVVTIKVRVY